jgi:hypothetical protein
MLSRPAPFLQRTKLETMADFHSEMRPRCIAARRKGMHISSMTLPTHS